MAKKKIKKLLKGLGIGAALLGAGKALMSRRDRNAMLNAADANDGFIDMLKGSRKRSINPAEFLIGIGDDPGGATLDGYPIQAGAKKGGRIVKGKKTAVRTKGFAKKKKQANKMRKK